MNSSINVPALVAERAKILDWLHAAQDREMEIRRQLTSYFFPAPKEGANRIEQDGYHAVLTHKLIRRLEEAALPAVMPNMPEEFRNVGVLVEYKAGLVLKGYRALSEDSRHIFDQALTITPASPVLEIKPLVLGGMVATTTSDPEQIKRAKNYFNKLAKNETR